MENKLTVDFNEITLNYDLEHVAATRVSSGEVLEFLVLNIQH